MIKFANLTNLAFPSQALPWPSWLFFSVCQPRRKPYSKSSSGSTTWVSFLFRWSLHRTLLLTLNVRFLRQSIGSRSRYTVLASIEFRWTDFPVGICSRHCPSCASRAAGYCTRVCRDQGCKGTIDATKTVQETVSRRGLVFERLLWYDILCLDLLHADLLSDRSRWFCHVVWYPLDPYADAYLRLLRSERLHHLQVWKIPSTVSKTKERIDYSVSLITPIF